MKYNDDEYLLMKEKCIHLTDEQKIKLCNHSLKLNICDLACRGRNRDLSNWESHWCSLWEQNDFKRLFIIRGK